MRSNNEENRCPQRYKIVITILVAIHFLGVLTQPLRFFSRSATGEGPEFVWLSNWMRPYAQWLYLDHGYFFFAPNPGPAHLVQYTGLHSRMDNLSNGISSDTGENATAESSTRVFPDRNAQWPRLLYHRYFMLSEFYNSRFAPTQVSEELKRDPEFLARWNFDSNIYRQLQSSIQRSISKSSGHEKIVLTRLERALPEPAEILREGLKLTDKRFLEVLPESMIESDRRREEALPPKPNTETKR